MLVLEDTVGQAEAEPEPELAEMEEEAERTLRGERKTILQKKEMQENLELPVVRYGFLVNERTCISQLLEEGMEAAEVAERVETV